MSPSLSTGDERRAIGAWSAVGYRRWEKWNERWIELYKFALKWATHDHILQTSSIGAAPICVSRARTVALSMHDTFVYFWSLSSRTPRAVIINIRENRRDNQGWTIQRHWQHQVHKTQQEDKTEHKHTKQKTKKVSNTQPKTVAIPGTQFMTSE